MIHIAPANKRGIQQSMVVYMVQKSYYRLEMERKLNEKIKKKDQSK